MKRWLVAAGVAAGICSLHTSAQAFCGFFVSGADAKLFNNATQVVMMREGTRTVLSMQNAYQGPPEDFAMVTPVPIVLQQENVKTLPRNIFDKVDALTAPRLVEYWEQDPCMQVQPHRPVSRSLMMSGAAAAPRSKADDKDRVKIEAQFTVGEYEIVVLSAGDSMGLDRWLRRNNYKIPQGAEESLRPYVQMGMKFFVAKVNIAKVTFEKGQAVLSPLRFHYDTDAFTLPIRLGLINSGGTQDLIVNILARGQRYEVANYENVAIPTNIDVKDAAKKSFGTFYATLFDKTMEKHPKGVVTEYAWDAQSCDPCPTPPLDMGEIMTLGADVLGPNPDGAQPGAPSRPGRGWSGGMSNGGFTITRLHARYTKAALGDDLHFRAAPPIQGGRESLQSNGKLEEGAIPGGTNNFQGRYAVRHPWAGAVACANPRRGLWGGPPGLNGPTQPGGPMAAAKSAFAPRGGLELNALISGALPAESLLSTAGPTPVVSYPNTMAEEPDAGSGEDAAAPTTPSAMPSAVPAPAKSGGCAGCSVGSDTASAGALAGAILGIGLLFARRRPKAL